MCSKEMDLLDKDYFNKKNQKDLNQFFLLKQTTELQRQQIKVNLCSTSLRVFNKVCSSVFSKNVMLAMQIPLEGVKKYLIDFD